MTRESRGRLGVSQLGLAKHFATHRRQSGVIFYQLFSRVDMIVVMVGRSIVIKPRLNSFGEIFVMIGGGIFPLPQPREHRGVIRGL